MESSAKETLATLFDQSTVPGRTDPEDGYQVLPMYKKAHKMLISTKRLLTVMKDLNPKGMISNMEGQYKEIVKDLDLDGGAYDSNLIGVPIDYGFFIQLRRECFGAFWSYMGPYGAYFFYILINKINEIDTQTTSTEQKQTLLNMVVSFQALIVLYSRVYLALKRFIKAKWGGPINEKVDLTVQRLFQVSAIELQKYR